MQVLLSLDGRKESQGGSLLMHNERLGDPLDPLQQALAEITGIRKKTQEHHIEMARREFFGGLYTSPPISDLKKLSGQIVGLPAWNIVRCLQEGAKRSKRGKDILRGVVPSVEFAPLIYDGPPDAEELWKSRKFDLRKGVGVSRSRVMRTRPIFSDWQAYLPVEVDPEIFDVEDLRICWKDAGIYEGIGDMRPVMGRFRGTLEANPPEYIWNSAVLADASREASEQFIARIREREKEVASKH